ncbi:MAG: DinB family protein [Flavobacteriales bacterium]|nr:DinB family protein [Flavobacteriales bacterium]
MHSDLIIRRLKQNATTFQSLFALAQSREEQTWKPSPEKWCMLEIVCHLRDEEVEDFRTRVRVTIESPESFPSSIDPGSWVLQRRYIDQQYDQVVAEFLKEREKSIRFLEGLVDPNWENGYQHPQLGRLRAKDFLENWLAHDLLHIRQIVRLQHAHLGFITQSKLDYAGPF